MNQLSLNFSLIRDIFFSVKERRAEDHTVFLILLLSFLLPPSLQAKTTPENIGIDYDIVYVRYPAVDPSDDFVTVPQGEKPYEIAAGADLMLLHPDGSETILVDCTACSAMDPAVSLDGREVYYSLIVGATIESASWIYKIDLAGGPPYQPIRLSFDDGFDSSNYAGNSSPEHDQASKRGIRDMAPFPLSDGRIIFTSNRAGLTAFNPSTHAIIRGSIQQLYILDNHDGSLRTAAESNLHRIETSTMHTAQHPIQLKDGRILFSSWQDAGNKYFYAMMSLFTIHPDGSNFRQFTEPHDHHKNVEHFITQLPDEQVVAGWYYPSFDYGFGALLRYPISDPSGIDFLRFSVDARNTFGSKFKTSYRELDRKGTTNITAHTSPKDRPAPNLSGKYAMPSATVNGDLLVAYSTGSVNHFAAACKALDQCEALKSGIYLIRSAGTTIIDDPLDSNKLVMVKNDPNYNEIWPRAVVPYQAIHGINRPRTIPNLTQQTENHRLKPGEAAAIVGTSSMYNRDPSDRKDKFQSSKQRELHDGNWTIQGGEAGVFTNDDIYAVRIVATPPKPFTKPISNSGSSSAEWEKISRFLDDERLRNVVARYGSLHNERWEILGEFPLSHKDSTDLQDNPDTSWMAKIPADTPFFIQTLDRNGMTIISELTWRALKSGESRTDCGGCHAHSIPGLDFSTTQAGKGAQIQGIPGVVTGDARVSDGTWDLTSGSIPTLSSNGVTFVNGYSLDVEFNRDILPILTDKCISCHTPATDNGGLILDGVDPNDAWGVLTEKRKTDGTSYVLPQRSKYIRIPQARESLLVWIVYGQRLDGRTNTSRADDVDYPNMHPALDMTDLEKRTFARWVDLGSPVNFPNTNGFGYTDDNQLPIINVFSPKRGYNPVLEKWVLGVIDAKSGLDLSTLQVSYIPVNDDNTLDNEITVNIDINTIDDNGVLTLPMSANTRRYIFEVRIKDLAGNQNIDRRFVHKIKPQPGQAVLEVY